MGEGLVGELEKDFFNLEAEGRTFLRGQRSNARNTEQAILEYGYST